MKSSTRTCFAVALFAPLAVMLLTMFACLPAPVGDPEKSKVDPALTGIYRLQATNANDKSTQVVFVRPWDDKTYFVQFVDIKQREGKETCGINHYKAWLTTLGGKTFMTFEQLDDLRYAVPPGPDDKQTWSTLRLDHVEGTVEMRMVSPDSPFIKGLTTREQLEQAIGQHASEASLYVDDVSTFKKLGKDDQALIDEVLKKAGVK